MVLGNFSKEEIRQILISHIDDMKARKIILDRYDLICYCIGYFGKIDNLIFETINDLALRKLIER